MSDRLARQIGKRLIRFRKARGLTAEQLAYQWGISKMHISYIERGQRFPSIPMLMKIAAALEVPIAAFFDGRPGRPPKNKGKAHTVYLDDTIWNQAIELGQGNASAGIRLAFEKLQSMKSKLEDLS